MKTIDIYSHIYNAAKKRKGSGLFRTLFGILLIGSLFSTNTGFALTSNFSVVSAAAPTGTANFCQGSASAFSDVMTGGSCVGAGNLDSVTWQWYYDATAIAGARGTFVVGSAGVQDPVTLTAGLASTIPAGTHTLSVKYTPNQSNCGNTAGTAITSSTLSITVKVPPVAIVGNSLMCTGGSNIALTDASGNGTWTSNAIGTASVNSNTGVVSPVAQGLATITYDNGCGSAAVATVTVYPTPVVHTFTGGGGYCIDAVPAGVPVGLTLSDTGVSYQLYLAGTPVGSAVAGTGSAISFGGGGLFTTVGVYHAIATNNITTCTSYLSGITIRIDSLPDTFSVTGGGSYCLGGSFTASVGLSGSQSGVSYQLYDSTGTAVGSPIIGDGFPLDFGGQGAGVYHVIATGSAATHCVNTMNGTATITFWPQPVKFNVTGGGSTCGAFTVPVGLDSSEVDVTYDLLSSLGGNLIPYPFGNNTFTGAGAAFTFGTVIPSTYVVIATSVNGCVDTMGTVTMTFNLPPTAFNVTVSGNGRYCLGDSGVHVGLSGSAAGVRYVRFNAAGTAVDTLYGTGTALDYGWTTVVDTYMVVATDTTTHCVTAMTGTAIVFNNPLVVPTVTISTGLGHGNAVCYGNPVTFTAQTTEGGTTPTYVWTVNGVVVSSVDSTLTYMPTNNDFIGVEMTSSSFCARPDTAINTMRVNVDTLLPPAVSLDVYPVTTITHGDSVSLTATPVNGGPAPRYQWYLNGSLVAGATNPVFSGKNFNNRDSICVRMTNSGGCGGVHTFNCVVLTVFPVSVINVAQVADIKLIPNPNKGDFMIKGSLSSVTDEEASIEVTNMIGQVIYRSNVTIHNGEVNERIQLSSLANGMYLLNLKTQNANNVFRFVVE
jgi:hypothetical protein